MYVCVYDVCVCAFQDERILYDMHMKSLALSIGVELDKVSARNWNSYESFPQFSGPSFVIKQGLGSLLMKMGGGLGIEYNKKVQAIISCYKTRLISLLRYV